MRCLVMSDFYLGTLGFEGIKEMQNSSSVATKFVKREFIISIVKGIYCFNRQMDHTFFKMQYNHANPTRPIRMSTITTLIHQMWGKRASVKKWNIMLVRPPSLIKV